MSGLAILCPGQGNQSAGMFDRVRGNSAGEDVLCEAASLFGEHPALVSQREAEAKLFANAFAQRLIATAILASWASSEEPAGTSHLCRIQRR